MIQSNPLSETILPNSEAVGFDQTYESYRLVVERELDEKLTELCLRIENRMALDDAQRARLYGYITRQVGVWWRRELRYRRGRIVRRMRQRGMTWPSIGDELGVSRVRAQQLAQAD